MKVLADLASQRPRVMMDSYAIEAENLFLGGGGVGKQKTIDDYSSNNRSIALSLFFSKVWRATTF